jgi:hypothetical protein
LENWLAYWCGLTSDYPKDENNNPKWYTEEEYYVAYLCGIAPDYPVNCYRRVGAYLRYIISARWDRPEKPLTREEYYLSLMSTTYLPPNEPASVISLDGTAEAPFGDLKIYGNTTQETLTGKNLFNYQDIHTLALSGTGGGTVTQSSTYRSYYCEVNVGSTYTFSRASASSTNRCRIAFTKVEPAQGVAFYGLYGEQGTFVQADTLTKVTFTVPSEMVYAIIYLSNADETITEEMHIQLELGSTDTSYEPYTGGLPAPNPSYPMPVQTVTGEQTVSVTGKNLWNPTPYQENHFIAADGTESTNTTTNTWGNIYVPAGTSMAISATPGDTSSTAIRVHAFTLDGVWKEQVAVLTLTGGNYGSATFTTPNEPVLLRWCGSKKLSSCQLELGSTATAYQPYQSQSYEVNLGKNLFTLDGITPTGNQYITYEQLGSNSLKLTALSGIGSYSDKTFKYSLEQLGLKVGDTVSLKMDMTGTYASRQCRVYYNAIPSTVVATLTPTNNAKTFTIPSGTTDILLLFYVANGETPSANSTATYSNIQLELGSTPTDFAPYFPPIELCKIGDYQDVIYRNVQTSGKNLWGGIGTASRELNGITWTTNQDGTITGNGTASSSTFSSNSTIAVSNNLFKVLPAGTYTLSALGSIPSGIQIRAEDVHTMSGGDATFGEISSSVSSATFTLTESTDLCIRTKAAAGVVLDNATFKPMLERGPVATGYEPHQNPYYDSDLPDGAWCIHKAIAHKQLDVSITGIRQDGNAHADYASYAGAFAITAGAWNNAGGDYNNDITNARQSTNCGQYLLQSIGSNGGANVMVDGTFCQRSGTNDRLYMRFSSMAGKTGAELKAILSAQGGSDFYYYLATPTNTAITNTTLIAQLDALLEGGSYEPQTNITLTAADPNLPGLLQVTVAKYQ